MRSQKLPKAKPNFRIYSYEIGKYSTEGITLDGVTEGYLNKFTEKEIEKAKELKAKQLALYNADPSNRKKPEYTDDFYLDYAKSLCYEEILGKVLEVSQRRLNNYDIKDVYWAQYSYEEILEMEEAGYDIPMDVIKWAHAQQQSDVTDYIVVSDANETDDNSSTSDETGSDQLSKYRAQSINDIAKIEKAEKETKKNVEEYEETKSKAKSVQSKNKLLHDAEFENLESKTKEWKKLNEKKEAGKLSKFEEIKLKNLTKELQGGQGGIISAIESNATELDKFLSQLDTLNEKITENNETIVKTVQNATELTNIQKQYPESKLPIPKRGIKIDGKGLSTSTLYGIRMEDLPKIAIQESRDLEHLDRSVVNGISSDKTQKLVKFAGEYTQRVQEVTNQTKELVGGSDDKSKEDEKDNKDKNQDNYKVAKVFSAANSVAATAITIAATSDMKSKQNKATKQQKDLNKQIADANKDAKALEKEASLASSEHQANLSQEEAFLMELDELNSKQPEVVKQSAQNDENAEQTNAAPQVSVSAAEDDNSSEKADIVQQIGTVQQREHKTLSDFIKVSDKSKVSNAKGKVFANILRGETTTFEQARKTAVKVANDTTVVGIGTTVLGEANTVIGSIMVESGTAMAASLYPPTVIAGLKLIASGVAFVQLGAAEIITGQVASVTGAATSEIALAAKSVTDTNQAADKTSQAATKENDAIIAGSQSAVGIETAPAAQTGDNSSSQPSAPTSESAEATPVQGLAQSASLSTEALDTEVLPLESETPAAEITQETPEPTDSENGKTNLVSAQSGSAAGSTPTEETEETSETKAAEENKIPASSTRTSASDITSITLNSEINNQQTTIAGKVSDSQAKDTEQRNKNADDRNNSDKQETTNIYNVAKDFSIPGSVNAMRVTAKATQDVTSRKATIENRQQALNTNVANLDENTKNIDKFQKEAEAESKVIVDRAAQAKAQIEIETSNIRNAAEQYNEANLLQAQDNIQSQVSQVEGMNAAGLARLDGRIASVNGNLKTAQGIQTSLNGELSSFRELLRQQYTASTDTIAVGFGTVGMGSLHVVEGTGLILGGQALVASAGLNPVQHALGLSMISNGTIMTGYGRAEQVAGMSASAEGTAGVVANANLDSVKNDGEETTKTSRTFLSITSENVRKNTQASQEIARGEEQSIDEVNAIAASATANANSVEIYDTDDKADKKLARFNKETELESRRRRKRVNAVSASTRG